MSRGLNLYLKKVASRQAPLKMRFFPKGLSAPDDTKSVCGEKQNGLLRVKEAAAETSQHTLLVWILLFSSFFFSSGKL